MISIRTVQHALMTFAFINTVIHKFYPCPYRFPFPFNVPYLFYRECDRYRTEPLIFTVRFLVFDREPYRTKMGNATRSAAAIRLLFRVGKPKQNVRGIECLFI